MAFCMESRVYIIVPIYNASLYLHECLDSILRQTYKDWTCILVNDGSTDNSQSIIDEYCALDDRFSGVNKENEQSGDKAKMYGVKCAQSDFVFILDADDILGDDDYVDKLMKRQWETQADIVLSRMYCFEKEIGNIVWILPNEQFDLSQVIDGESACLLTIPKWLIGLNGCLTRRELYDSSFPFSEGNWACLDEVRSRELLQKSRRVAFSDSKYYFRKNPMSVTHAISPFLFDRTINDAALVQFAQEHFSKEKALIGELAKIHFLNLRQSIVDYEGIKEKLTEEGRKRVEKAFAQSYYLMDIGLQMKRSVKWGIAIVILRRFSFFQHIVIALNRKT